MACGDVGGLVFVESSVHVLIISCLPGGCDLAEIYNYNKYGRSEYLIKKKEKKDSKQYISIPLFLTGVLMSINGD